MRSPSWVMVDSRLVGRLPALGTKKGCGLLF
jgi:hypothetical protein